MKYNRYQKRDAVKNYFPLPNEIFCLDLSAGEIAVYAYLMYCEDRKTFQCHPSYKTIGSAVGLSKNTVKKHIDGLVAKQLITTEPTTVITKKGQKHNGTLLYTIRPIQEAVNHYYERQLARCQAEMYRKKALARIEKLYGNARTDGGKAAWWSATMTKAYRSPKTSSRTPRPSVPRSLKS